MEFDIKVIGWAPGGEPAPIGGSVTLTLQLSSTPHGDWPRMFKSRVEEIRGEQPNVSYLLNSATLNIKCPASIMISCVEGAKAMVLSINGPAAAEEKQRAELAERAMARDAEIHKQIRIDAAKIKF